MARERFPVLLLGKTIGTSTGWDQWGDSGNGMRFYEFQAEPDIFPEPLPASCALGFDSDSGKLEVYDNAGNGDAAPIFQISWSVTLA